MKMQVATANALVGKIASAETTVSVILTVLAKIALAKHVTAKNMMSPKNNLGLFSMRPNELLYKATVLPLAKRFHLSEDQLWP